MVVNKRKYQPTAVDGKESMRIVLNIEDNANQAL